MYEFVKYYYKTSRIMGREKPLHQATYDVSQKRAGFNNLIQREAYIYIAKT